jgi:hypothetical protein
MANTLHLAAEGYEVQCPRSIAAAVDAVSGAIGGWSAGGSGVS